MGNIVRSPLAENMFRHLAQERGVGDKYEVDSAGTSAYHVGESPDARMRQVALEHGLEYSGQARKFEHHDFSRFDLIVAMDEENRDVLKRMAASPEQEAKIRMLREYDPQGKADDPVPDPYYGGMDGFKNVFRIVRRATEGLLEALERGEEV